MNQVPVDLKKTEESFACSQQVTAAVANFYVPTLSMLYIYGRIFRTIRQRSRNDLGEVTTAAPPAAAPPTNNGPNNPLLRRIMSSQHVASNSMNRSPAPAHQGSVTQSDRYA